MAAQHPGELAVAVQQPKRQDGRYHYLKFTLRELDQISDRVAHGLSTLGITRGTRTVLMVKPSIDFFALTFALFKTGAIPVFVDPGMGVKNLGVCLAEAAPEAFIGIPKAHIARVLLGWARPSLRILVTVGTKLGWGGTTLAVVARSASERRERFPMIEPAPHETAAILFTSGSTGVPKGAVYTHEIFNAQVESLRRDYGIQPGERDLATFPLFALFGPALGMAAIIPDMDASKPGEADPKKIIAAIQDHVCTNMFGSPALLDVVGRYGAARGIKLSTLKRVISAGAPANIPSLQRLTTMLNEETEILPSYGATEALPVAYIGSKELFTTAVRTDQGAGVCVGRPIMGMDVRVIKISDEPIPEWSDGLLAAPGEIGEITVRGPVVTRAYFNRPESTALAKIQDVAMGEVIHRMGDVGYFDAQGRLWMCGRKSQRVVTAEKTYFTIPCERIFNTHPSVRRTALVGVVPRSAAPGGRGTTEAVLCVELEREVSRSDYMRLREELLALAGTHKTTKGIETVLFHPCFPVDIRHNAKIFREKLALWAEHQVSHTAP
ncbi:MAG: AMP-binding protein [Candidatus Hydrogenedentes bacterium]|nr:AMP-binding protein [Candidatus Hydrogenedentota bacterium]